MSLFHNSVAAEKLALYTHIFWAVTCVVHGGLAVAGGAAIYPMAGFRGASVIFFMLLFTCTMLGLLGAFGAVWHIYGAHLHRKNLEELAKRDA